MSDSFESKVSLSVAQKIVKNYFQTVMGDRKSVIVFYSSDATLIWGQYEFHGPVEIQKFYQELPIEATFRITGFDFQTVPYSNFLTMVIVYGSYEMEPSSPITDFHCVFYVDTNVSDESSLAFIKYQAFNAS